MNRQHHRTTNAILLTLALTASVAPVAWADPPPQANAEAATAANHSLASTPVRPNPDQQTVTGATTPAGPCSEVCSGGGYGYVTPLFSTGNQTGATLPHDPRPRPTVLSTAYNTTSTPATVVRVAPDGSFDWGDAGIGAGAALVLVAIGLAGTRAATNSRKRHPRERRATARS
jgi:hypothetical protein